MGCDCTLVTQWGNLARITLQCTIVQCIVLGALVGARSVFERNFTLDAEGNGNERKSRGIDRGFGLQDGKKSGGESGGADRVGEVLAV